MKYAMVLATSAVVGFLLGCDTKANDTVVNDATEERASEVRSTTDARNQRMSDIAQFADSHGADWHWRYEVQERYDQLPEYTSLLTFEWQDFVRDRAGSPLLFITHIDDIVVNDGDIYLHLTQLWLVHEFPDLVLRSDNPELLNVFRAARDHWDRSQMESGYFAVAAIVDKARPNQVGWYYRDPIYDGDVMIDCLVRRYEEHRTIITGTCIALEWVPDPDGSLDLDPAWPPR